MLKSPKGRKAKLTRMEKETITITTMGEVISYYLTPSNSNGMYSIGSEAIDHPYGPEYTAGCVRDLRRQTVDLRVSQHPNDVDAVRNINKVFVEHDHKLATRHLNHNLREPIGKDILEWLAYAPDRDVAKFCKWSFERTHRLTQALRRDRPDFITDTLHRTSELVKSGPLPALALPVIESATQRFSLHGMDTFYRGGMNAVGFCGPETIGLANRYNMSQYMHFPSSGMRKTVFHEYLHGAGKDRGFFWGLRTRLPVARILEEAFVEHMSVVAFSPSIAKKPFVTDPAKRHGNWTRNSCYRSERTFMTALIEHADIGLDHLSEAYFRHRGDERGEWLREDIERKIGQFFGSRYAFFDFIHEYEITQRSNRSTLLTGKINELTRPSAA